MSQPNWITSSSNLGVFPSNIPLSINLVAEPVYPAVNVTYSLLNGSLPTGTNSDPIILSDTGVISGTPKNVRGQVDYVFTVRATDNLNNITDRTFSFSVYGLDTIKISTGEGLLFSTIDSVYIDYSIQVNDPFNDSIPYFFTLSSGSLPPGLYMSDRGRITGYPEKPTLLNGSITSKTYQFTVQLISELDIDTKTYSITVNNQELNNPPNTRKPTILNNTPLVQPLLKSDPYYDYYLPESNIIPTVNSDDYFSFKIIGHDFDGEPLKYAYGVLPPGLVGDPVTGWITGTPTTAEDTISKFKFSVTVSKLSKPYITSDIETYEMTITNNVIEDIVWESPSNFVLNNGSISELYLKAKSDFGIQYRLMSGSLPPNLRILDNGQIIGKVPNQPTTNMLEVGQSTDFTFTVRAFNPQFPVSYTDKQFTITIYQKYGVPTENIYLKAAPNKSQRLVLQSLLENEDLIPTNYLYRPDDVYFGKAKDVKYTHIYGVNPVNIQRYFDALQKNHYTRKLVLGDIKTAVARDENNNIVYEVVYSTIVDDLENSSGQSVQKEIVWPYKIALSQGPYYTASDLLYTTEAEVYTSSSPDYIKRLYPSSLQNMRVQTLSMIPHVTDVNLLPKWMTTQQENGNTLGFIQAWVICYTLPGYSETIKNNITNYWGHRLNEIDFTVDRYIVDRSGSYDYDTTLASPMWSNLPSSSPTPDPLDFYDVPVLFPHSTILPNSTGN